jgi:hypothetical protein
MMRNLVLSALIFLGLISPSWAVEDPDLNVLFVGLHEGRDISCKEKSEIGKMGFNDKLYCTIFNLLGKGEKEGAKYFLNMPIGAASAERIKAFSTLTKKGNAALSDIKLSKSADGVPIDSVVLAFFSLDDIVFMRSVQGNGLQRLTAYVLLSFHAFSFNDREITYTSNFVLPLSLKTRGDDYQTDFLCRLGKCNKSYSSKKIKKEVAKIRKKVGKYLGGYFRTALKIIANGKRFNTTLDNLLEREGDVGYFAVRMNIDVHNYRKQDSKVKMSKLSEFASVMASAQLSKDVMIVPSFVATDRTLPLVSRDENEQSIHKVVLSSRNSLSRLTKTRVFPNKSDGEDEICGTLNDGAQYRICKNIFPEVDSEFKMKLSLARKSSGTKGNFQLDSLTSKLKILLQIEEDTACTMTGKSHTNMHYNYKDKYAKGSDVRRGEAGFYNVTFSLFKKIFSKKSMIGEQGVFGPTDLVGEKTCGG